MKMINKPFGIISLFVIIILASLSTTASAANLVNDEANYSLNYAQSIKENGFLVDNDSDTIMIVGGWRITQADLDYRVTEYKEIGKDASIPEILNVLFEEAALYAQAESLGLLPTNGDIIEYVNEIYADAYDVIKDSKTLNNSSILYYGFKFLVENNVYQHYLTEGRELGLIAPLPTSENNVLTNYKYGNGDDYYCEHRIAFKEEVPFESYVSFYPVKDKVVQIYTSTNEISITNASINNRGILNKEDIIASSKSLTPNVLGDGSGVFLGQAADWGAVYLPYDIYYSTIRYVSSGNKYLSGQDIVISSSTITNLPPPFRSRVYAYPVQRARIYKSDGVLVKTFSSFNGSVYYDYFWNYIIWARGSVGAIIGSASNNYYAEITSGIGVEDCQYPSGSPISFISNSF